VADGGSAWLTTLPANAGTSDSSDHPQRSTLVLFEDDEPLVPAHTPHDRIRAHGRGAYSHWHNTLYFSTSDGSDPRVNGRLYRAFADAAAASAAIGQDVVARIDEAKRRRYEDDSLHGCPATAPYNQNCGAFGDPVAAAQYDKQIYDGWTNHLETWAGRSTGLNILELGPGISLGAQALLAERGNRVTVADPFPPPWNPEFHPIVYRRLATLVGGSTTLERAAEGGSFVGIDVRQVKEPAEALSSLREQEFDVVLSNATLEHVADLDRVCAELARITKRGGLNFHQIDLSYHKDRERPLDHLLCSDAEFIAEATQSNFEYGNRWRKSEFIARFNRAGFELIHEVVTLQAEPDYLAEIASLRGARGRYGRWPLDDLQALSTFLVARRPNAVRCLIPLMKGRALVGIQNWRKRGAAIPERSLA
jgi:SAM-dependent methyltransferase